jgi:hypothetical protein
MIVLRATASLPHAGVGVPAPGRYRNKPAVATSPVLKDALPVSVRFRHNPFMFRPLAACAPEEASDGIVQMAWAQDAATRRPAHVSEVPRGAACGCVCLGCGSPLVARKGQTAHHFAHKAEASRCSPALVAAAWETELHKLAKEVLAEGSEIALPELVARRFGRQKRLRPPRRITYQQTHREHEAVQALALEDIVPDAVVYVDGHPLSIEIRVTHESKEQKRARMAAQGLHGIQIDLRTMDRFASRTEIARSVLDTAPREWLYHRAVAPALAAIEAEVTAEERAVQARLDAAIAAVEQAYNAHRTTAAKLRPDLARAGLTSVIGLGIEGQNCMTETAACWQARILNLIFEQPPEKVFATGIFAEIARRVLHPAFRPWRSWDDAVLQGLRERFKNFQTPDAVVAGYLEALSHRDVLRPGNSFRRDAWLPAFDLAARLKQVEEAERRLDAVRRLVAELAASAESFDLDAWMTAEQPRLYATPDSLCLEPMHASWTFSTHPADRLITQLDDLKRLLSPLPAFTPGHAGPPPWSTWPAPPSAVTEHQLFGLPLRTHLLARQAEEAEWRSAAAAKRDALAEKSRVAEDNHQRADGAAFLDALQDNASSVLGDADQARAWIAEQVKAVIPGGDTIIRGSARQRLTQALDRLAWQRENETREAAETADLIRRVLDTRAPLFADLPAAEAWLRSPRGLGIAPDTPLPYVLPATQRSLLRAALETAVNDEHARRAAEAAAAAAASPEVVALREDLRGIAAERWSSPEAGDNWLARGRLADAYQKPIDRCRDRASFAELLRALDADILASRTPPKLAPRRRR